jgi:hypothetical protein
MAKKKKEDQIDKEEKGYGLFMNEDSFNLDVQYGRMYMETDAPFYVKYYKINVITSKVHSLYGESKPGDKKFFAPIELNVMPEVQDSEGKSFGGLVREDTGNLEFGIFDDELSEKGIEMVRGDYVSINVSGNKERYFEIETADYVNDSTSKTRGGFKSYWRKVVAVPVKEDVVPMISNQI